MDGRPVAKLLATRFTSSGGAGAPPPPTLARLDVSKSANRGDSSRSQLCVGTPTKLVTRSRSISSSARSGSHLYIITSFRPLAKHDSITGTQPVTWNSGTIRMNTGGPADVGASSGRRSRVERGAAAEAEQRLQDGAVGRHRALRVAGRARRVEDRGVVVGCDRRRRAWRGAGHDDVVPVVRVARRIDRRRARRWSGSPAAGTPTRRARPARRRR